MKNLFLAVVMAVACSLGLNSCLSENAQMAKDALIAVGQEKDVAKATDLVNQLYARIDKLNSDQAYVSAIAANTIVAAQAQSLDIPTAVEWYKKIIAFYDQAAKDQKGLATAVEAAKVDMAPTIEQYRAYVQNYEGGGSDGGDEGDYEEE